jgi:hypothetical protein
MTFAESGLVPIRERAIPAHIFPIGLPIRQRSGTRDKARLVAMFSKPPQRRFRLPL